MALVKRRPLRVEDKGCVAYGVMHRLQQARQRAAIEGRSDDTLFLLEHAPVITLGKNAQSNNLLADREVLTARGVELYETSRGGDITFHGPGQLVAYPILVLQNHERDIRRYVTGIEEVMIRTCADFGVVAERVDGLRGIWVGPAKIGALGIRVARWTTMHGLALNVSVDLSFFDLIVPCGIRDRGVTSLARELGRAPPMDAVKGRVACHSAEIFRRRLVFDVDEAEERRIDDAL